MSYNAVCGRAIGYQFGSPDGILNYGGIDIDRNYVDGLSITYGGRHRRRRHIWTYAAGHTGHCLCQPNNVALQPPWFVGQHYYCDGRELAHHWNTGDPLWDKTGCPSGNTCCDSPNQPWFHRRLGRHTATEIEVRWCQREDEQDESIGIELLELYVN